MSIMTTMTRYGAQYGPDITAALANRVVLEALSAIARRDERDGTTWDPGRPLLDGRGEG